MKRVLILVALFSYSAVHAAVTTVTVSGKIVTPGAMVASAGTITATLSSPGTTSDGTQLQAVAGRTSVTIGTAGAIALVLVPNDAISPSGTSYKVTYSVTAPTSTSWSETWQLVSSPSTIAIGSVTRLNQAPGLTCLPTATGTSGNVLYNSAGALGGDSLFTWDSVNKRLGVNLATPTYTLDVSGSARATSLTVSGASGTGSRCAHFDGSGALTATSAECGSGGGGGFDGITTATNTTATMTVGTGATIAPNSVNAGIVKANFLPIGTSPTCSATADKGRIGIGLAANNKIIAFCSNETTPTLRYTALAGDNSGKATTAATADTLATPNATAVTWTDAQIVAPTTLSNKTLFKLDQGGERYSIATRYPTTNGGYATGRPTGADWIQSMEWTDFVYNGSYARDNIFCIGYNQHCAPQVSGPNKLVASYPSISYNYEGSYYRDSDDHLMTEYNWEFAPAADTDGSTGWRPFGFGVDTTARSGRGSSSMTWVTHGLGAAHASEATYGLVVEDEDPALSAPANGSYVGINAKRSDGSSINAANAGLQTISPILITDTAPFAPKTALDVTMYSEKDSTTAGNWTNGFIGLRIKPMFPAASANIGGSNANIGIEVQSPTLGSGSSFGAGGYTAIAIQNQLAKGLAVNVAAQTAGQHMGNFQLAGGNAFNGHLSFYNGWVDLWTVSGKDAPPVLKTSKWLNATTGSETDGLSIVTGSMENTWGPTLWSSAATTCTVACGKLSMACVDAYPAIGGAAVGCADATVVHTCQCK